jgi:choline/glycine/proline betaine transport protein
VEHSLFTILGDLPWGTVFSVVGILLVAIFFITSSDSGSMVVDMLASGGHPNPPTWSRVLWSLVEGAVAIALLLAGGLNSLQSASLATAVPFTIVLLLMLWSTFRALKVDAQVLRRADRMKTMDRITQHVTREWAEHIDESPQVESYVDQRIDYRISRTRGIFNRRSQKSDED